MESRSLEAFVAVAEELHFGRAAQRLHIAQSPLSQTIRRLEASVGATLFDRNTRTVSLTPAGRALLPMAYRVLNDMALATAAARAASGQVSGTVRLGFSGAFNHLTLPALARAVRRELPEVDLQLISRIRTADGVAKLRNGTLDISFVGLPLSGSSGIASRAIERSTYGAVVPVDHPLAGAGAISAAQLADDDFLSMPLDGTSTAAEGMMRLCVAAGFRPNIAQEITDPYMVLTFVAAGMGVTLTADDMKSILPEGAVWLDLTDPPVYLNNGIAWKADGVSPAVAAVLALAAEVLPEPTYAD